MNAHHNHTKATLTLRKSNSQESLDSRLEASKATDPFVNEIIMTKADYLTCFLGTIFILPFRAAGVIFVLILAWIIARVCLINLDVINDPKCKKALKVGWREKLRKLYSYCGLLCFWAAGFKVVMKGRQARRDEAPILVGAPHSSFLEALVIVMCQSSPVSRHENKDAILISTCQLLYETIFVDRRSPESRTEAANEICSRSWSKEPSSQIFIFPEGTNTNRKKLIQFKKGAFNPGVPVQPVIIHYRGYEHLDSITWTFKQNHSYLFSVWLLLVKPFNKIEIEFLPVYTPDDNEKSDPVLFAKNVQKFMASKLNIFASDDTYYEYYMEHCKKLEGKL